MMHIKESVFDGKYPNADRLDLVARMGGPLYCRASGPAVFELPKPTHTGIGFDALPESVRNSRILTGNDLGKLAGARELPDRDTIREKWEGVFSTHLEPAPDELEIELRVGDPEHAVAALAARVQSGARVDPEETFHRIAQLYLRRNEIDRAWECAMAPEVVAMPAISNAR